MDTKIIQKQGNYRQTFNIKHTLVGNKIIDQSEANFFSTLPVVLLLTV